MGVGDVTANISKLSGKAMQFDGAAKIQLPAGGTLHITDKITISCWFKMPIGAAADEKIYNKGDDVDKEMDIVFENGNPEAVCRYTTGELKCVYAVDHRDGVWHHITVTAEANQFLKLYVDGSLRDTKTIVDSTLPNADDKNAYIGMRINWQGWSGKIDNFRVWNRILSASEISDDNNGKPVSRLNLAAHYPFQNPTTPAEDISGNGNDGTVTAAVQTGGYDSTEDDIESARVNANSKYGLVPLASGREIMTVHIEEA